MAEFLILAKTHWMDSLTPTELLGLGPAEKDGYTARSQKGDIVVVKPDGWGWGTSECPPDFVVVKVPSITVEEALSKAGRWSARGTITILSSDPATDTHSVLIQSDAVNLNTGEGKITVDRINQYLLDWKLKNITVGDNSVQFDATISEVIQSNRYWGMEVSLCTFAETQYDQATGRHRTRIDASALNLDTAAFDAFVAQVSQHGTFVSQNVSRRQVVLDVMRSAVRDAFVAFLRRVSGRLIREFRYSISAAEVDAVLAAGGTVTLDRATVLAKIRDKMA